MKITLSQGPFGTYLITAENGEDRLIQTDYDFPGAASLFGWSPASVVNPNSPNCEHKTTDGTVGCGCGVKAGTFIESAREFLDDNDGAETEDEAGYWD